MLKSREAQPYEALPCSSPPCIDPLLACAVFFLCCNTCPFTHSFRMGNESSKRGKVLSDQKKTWDDGPLTDYKKFIGNGLRNEKIIHTQIHEKTHTNTNTNINTKTPPTIIKPTPIPFTIRQTTSNQIQGQGQIQGQMQTAQTQTQKQEQAIDEYGRRVVTQTKSVRQTQSYEEIEEEMKQLTAKYNKLNVDDFQLLKVIGKGSFGKVMQVRKKSNNKIYAMKVLKKEVLVKRRQVLHTKTERKVLAEIRNPFIVGLRYAFQTESKLYIVMDYFAGGELFYHLKQAGRFSEERAKFYAAEIILALEGLHKQNIVFRDLKPENVLLDENGHIRLTDFGLAKDGVANWYVSDTINLTKTFCGTPEYLAPEMIARQPYGLVVDWWSLGTLLFEMLTGLPPFYDSNLPVMYDKIMRAKLVMPVYISEHCQSLLYGLLERNYKQRIGYKNDADELKQHIWFSDINWSLLYEKKITAPFKPRNVGGNLDTSNVDDEFKRLPAADTPAGSMKVAVEFEAFTYAGSQQSHDGPLSNISNSYD